MQEPDYFSLNEDGEHEGRLPSEAEPYPQVSVKRGEETALV